MVSSVKLVRRVGGVMGELGRGLKMGGVLNADILAVGPDFQELDLRWLEADTKKAPFSRVLPALTPWH